MRRRLISVSHFTQLRSLLVVSLLVCCADVSRSAAQAPSYIENGNKNIARAMRQAKANLPRFLKRLSNPLPGDTSFEVKVHVGSDNPKVGAYIWLKDVERRGNQLVGTAYTVPRGVSSPTNGQRVVLPLARVDDWLIINSGKVNGGYTVRALLPYMQPDEAVAMRSRLGPL
jgi:uncharacterized protein YegJ (DUF2314 family)